MRRLFADAAYYVALLYRRDKNHRRAMELAAMSARDSSVRLVTSEPVLFEVLAFFSRFDAKLKEQAADFVAGLLADDSIEVVSPTPDLLDHAIALYKGRADQPYSLTDCVSMTICHDLKITDVLTADSDFGNEGFAVLLHD